MCTGLEIGFAVGSLVLGAAGTAYSVSEQSKQADKLRDAQKKQQKLEMAATNEKAARERRAQIRESRIQRAMVDNAAAASGQTGSSAAIVGGQAATQQAGVNIGNINTATSRAGLLGAAQQNVANAANATPSIMGSLAGGLGSQFMTLGLQKGTESIFKE
jgi:hypothetical protein